MKPYETWKVESRKRHACQAATKAMIKKGIIQKTPCLICGAIKDIEAHHPTYDDPVSVVFLCRKHHAEIHEAYRDIGLRKRHIERAKTKCTRCRVGMPCEFHHPNHLTP
jgi:hypothetical protein